jgi:hypothetical protein
LLSEDIKRRNWRPLIHRVLVVVQVLEGGDLDAAFASISAFELDRSVADAVLGVEEFVKLLR